LTGCGCLSEVETEEAVAAVKVVAMVKTAVMMAVVV
jgi:hypothetical protein